jgi:hypothetical protein
MLFAATALPDKIQGIRNIAEMASMRTEIEPIKHRTNRNMPVEQWPESLEILRHLAAQREPRSIKDVARGVQAPEISTRNRLAKLETQGAVVAVKATAYLAPGKQVTCTHYEITQYGKDCAGMRSQDAMRSSRMCVNSVFALASAMNLSI